MPKSTGMQLSFKVIQDTRYKKPDGTSPLKLRIYQGSAYKEKSLSLFVLPGHWDQQQQLVVKKHQLAINYNANLTELKAKVQKLILESSNLPWVVSPTDILNSIGASNERSRPTFMKYSDDYIEKLISVGKVGNARAYRCASNQLHTFMGNTGFYFEHITYKKLDDFKISLAKRGVKPNSIAVYLREIRAIFNHAINDGIVDGKYYPFNKVKIKGEKTVNRVLTPSQLHKIASFPLTEGTPQWHWRNYFMLSFTLIGINFADMLTLSNENIQQGRIVFRRRKTGKLYTIAIQPEAQRILSLYEPAGGRKGDLLLPIIQNHDNPTLLKKETLQACKTCSKYMKQLAHRCGIEIPVSTYYARYTWANTAKSLGFSKDLIAEALGHEYGNKVTGIYLDHYSNAEIDNANKAVIGTILNGSYSDISIKIAG